MSFIVAFILWSSHYLSPSLSLARERNELLILCGYIGALLAIGRQYSSIVPALYEYTSTLTVGFILSYSINGVNMM